MKLESLKLEKFKENALKKEQMTMLGAVNEVTGGGNIVTNHSNMGLTHINYGYDVDRFNGDTFIGRTYHDRTLYHSIDEVCQYT